MNSLRLCIEGQITIYYCTDTDPSALLTVSPPSFQFKTILKILVLQFHVKVSRPFKYIGGGGGGGGGGSLIAIPSSRKAWLLGYFK